MAGAHGGSFERDDSAAFEDAVENGFGEVGVVQDTASALKGLVGGEDNGASPAVALVDDMEEDVGSVGAVGEESDFVNDEELGTEVGGQSVAEAAVAGRQQEGLDQIVGGGEEGVVAVQDGLVGDSGGEMGLAAVAAALEPEAAALGGGLGGEGGAEQQGAKFGLEGDVEFLQGVQDGEAGLAHAAAQAGLAAMLDLGRNQGGEEVAEGPGAALGCSTSSG